MLPGMLTVILIQKVYGVLDTALDVDMHGLAAIFIGGIVAFIFECTGAALRPELNEASTKTLEAFSGVGSVLLSEFLSKNLLTTENEATVLLIIILVVVSAFRQEHTMDVSW